MCDRVLQVISAIIFTILETDLPFGDALYHCFITGFTGI